MLQESGSKLYSEKGFQKFLYEYDRNEKEEMGMKSIQGREERRRE